MKVAVLGGGFAGLTAAYYLQKRGDEAVVYERDVACGGLAQGFKARGWDWGVERAYHHLFTTDTDILDFAIETGFEDIYFELPVTSSLYRGADGSLSRYQLDSPLKLLQLPLLSPMEKIAAGWTLGELKLSPFKSSYEEETALAYLRRSMGANASEVLFGELFRKKFGKYAEKIVASFIWARIKKRSQRLGYVKGGFQLFIDHLVDLLTGKGVDIRTGTAVQELDRKQRQFIVSSTKGRGQKAIVERFDAVINTLPTPIIAQVASGILPKSYHKGLNSIEYLNAISMIIETEKPLLDREYWLNICVKDMPMMVLVQHTNFVEPSHYGGKHLLYAGNYLPDSDEKWSMSDNELLQHYLPSMQELNPSVDMKKSRLFLFKAPYAQPIFNKKFVSVKPEFTTPVKGLYMAQLDMCYPNDRGTNFSVMLGRDVVKHVL